MRSNFARVELRSPNREALAAAIAELVEKERQRAATASAIEKAEEQLYSAIHRLEALQSPDVDQGNDARIDSFIASGDPELRSGAKDAIEAEERNVQHWRQLRDGCRARLEIQDRDIEWALRRRDDCACAVYREEVPIQRFADEIDEYLKKLAEKRAVLEFSLKSFPHTGEAAVDERRVLERRLDQPLIMSFPLSAELVQYQEFFEALKADADAELAR